MSPAGSCAPAPWQPTQPSIATLGSKPDPGGPSGPVGPCGPVAPAAPAGPGDPSDPSLLHPTPVNATPIRITKTHDHARRDDAARLIPSAPSLRRYDALSFATYPAIACRSASDSLSESVLCRASLRT